LVTVSKNKADTLKTRLISAVSLRMAVPSATIASLLVISILYLSQEFERSSLILIFLTVFITVFLSVYSVSAWLHFSRMKSINKVVKNITKKKFENYDNLTISQKDELDILLMQAIRASKTVEKELLRLNKIENYRKEFIGDISHELKTPIFAIQGFIETLLNGAIHDEEVNEVFLKKAMRNVNRLIYLTKDLMEISRLETGELKSDFQELYLRDVILDVVESLQYKAQKENIDIIVKEFDKNLQVRADRNQVKQVLINLIENGIKYNRDGGTVEIGIQPVKKDQDKIRLYIKDTGIGIESSDLSRVTERFYRVDKSRSRDKGGTGLGLSIVKHIIEAHGEELKIESNVDEGSTFSFTLTKVSHVSV
jgi:two-component system, OmpR family, phosphate regulon sensor histidine kinase PhoR